MPVVSDTDANLRSDLLMPALTSPCQMINKQNLSLEDHLVNWKLV